MYRVIKQKQESNNKYGAKGTEYNGRWYHSRFEAEYASKLDLLKRAGEIQEWIPQYKIDLKVNGFHITNYYMDFKVITKSGGIEFHEVKGYETGEWQMKWRLLEALLNEVEPGAEMILVKQQNNFKKFQSKNSQK